MWNEFIDFSEYAKIMMEGFCGRPETTVNGSHTDIRYTSDTVDLANISIIDMREKKKMWMMHVACFSKSTHPMPIYGFDVICGKNKVTGCFHDMSPTIYLDSPCEKKFAEMSQIYVPKRERTLPPWAQEIFSDQMVVAGATDEPKEIKNLVYMGKTNLFNWFDDLDQKEAGEPSNKYEESLSMYCKNQLSNTNSKNVMISLGLDEDYVTEFKKRQFPY